MNPLYFIKDWGRHFETSESRKLRSLLWVKIPNRHDGKGYRRLIRHPRHVEIFCAWNLIVQVASKMPERGTLADSDGPLTAQDISDATGFPVEIFEIALIVLCQQEIGWICVNDGREAPPVLRENLPTHRETPPARRENPPIDKRDEREEIRTDILLPCGSGVVAAGRQPTIPPGDAVTAERQSAGKCGDEDEPGAVAAVRQPAPIGTAPPETVTPGFAEFWGAWPKHFRKKGRSKCIRHWKSKGLESMALTIVAAVRRQKSSHPWTKEGGKFVPGPLVWLNDEGWEAPAGDEPADEEPDEGGFVRASPEKIAEMVKLLEQNP